MSRRTEAIRALIDEGVLLTGPTRPAVAVHIPRVAAALALPKR